MRVPVVVSTALLAACASRPLAPAPPPDSVARLVTALEASADRACACPDRACTDALDAELERTFAATPPLPLVRDDAFSRADAAIQRAIRCAWTHQTVAYAYGTLAVSLSASLRADTCACADDACFAALGKPIALRSLSLRAVPLRDDARARITAADAAAQACRDVEIDRAAAPIVDELRALRDRACACADATCGGEVRTDFTAWADRNGDTRASAALTETMTDIARELGTCIGQAMVKGAP